MKLDAIFRGVEEFQTALRRAERDQTPFATAQALTAVAFNVRREWQSEIKSRIHQPTRWVAGAPRVAPATKQSLEARIFIAGSGEAGRNQAKVLAAHAGAGARGTKGFERGLASAGILGAGQYVVPGRDAKLDAHGNLARGEVKILANVAARGDGSSEPPPAAGSGRRRRRVGSGAFVSPLGIMERNSSRGLRSVAFFVDGARYEQRVDFPDVGAKVFEQTYATEFEKQLARALESAR